MYFNDTPDLFGRNFEVETIDREMLQAVLTSILSELSLDDFVGLITNHFVESVEYIELINGGKTCQKTSLLFNPHRLETVAKGAPSSIYGALKNPSFLNGLARAIIFKNGKVKELLYQAIQLGVNGVQYINEFPPHVARDICQKYQLTVDSKVIDPCAGWGERMLGVSCAANQYHCFEPSVKTAKGLHKLSDFIALFRPSFAAKIYNIPFEDAIVPGKYDFAITSPPYYDSELYAPDEETQSHKRYKTFDDWSEGFFIPMVKRVMDRLEYDGAFILNIGSRKYPLGKIVTSNRLRKDYGVRLLGNLLSGKGGLGKGNTDGEMFFEITHL